MPRNTSPALVNAGFGSETASNDAFDKLLTILRRVTVTFASCRAQEDRSRV